MAHGSKLDLMQGTLDLMVLQTLAAMGPQHGYGLARRIEQRSGGDVLLNSFTALAPGGRLMIYGRASGNLPPLPPEQIFAKNLQVYGLNIGGLPWTQKVHRAALDEILQLMADGKVRPVISRTFPMAEVADAHRYLSNRQTMGKVILVPREQGK